MKKRYVKLGNDALSKKFAKLHKVDKEIMAIDGHLKKKGFKAQRGKKNFWGMKSTFVDKEKKATFTVAIQDYLKSKSKDAAAIGQLTLSANDRTETYTFELVAPNGNFKKAKEYRVDRDLKVSKTDSWWSCVLWNLARSLGASVDICYNKCWQLASVGGIFTWCLFLPCFTTCIGTIAPLLYPTVAACCTCNCQWWCAWAVGCCRQ